MGFLDWLAPRPAAEPTWTKGAPTAASGLAPSVSGATGAFVFGEPLARYDGARRGRQGQAWYADDRTPMEEARADLPWLRRRARDLDKNNPWARRAVGLICDDAVGHGVTAKIQVGRYRSVQRFATAALAWMESPQADLSGRASFALIQRLGVRTMVRDGEVMIRRIRAIEPRSGLPLRLQVLAMDWLDHSKDGPLSDGGFVWMGIEYDTRLQRVAYWLKGSLDTDPLRPRPLDAVRVPARDIIHLFRLDEPGQERGIPWGAAALWSHRDLADYDQAQVLRQKIAASTVIKHMTVSATQLPGEIGPDGKARKPSMRFEPGEVVRVAPGEDVQVVQMPGVDGYAEVQKVSLRRIAAAYPVSYVALSGDLSDTNYSSGKLGWQQQRRSIETLQWLELKPHLLDGVFAWLSEAWLLDAGDASATWTFPAFQMLDESKEIPAKVKKIRAGLASRQAVVREMGEDVEQIDAEIAEDNERSDRLKLSFDSDGRRPEQAKAEPAPANEPAPEEQP
jgi:lambda family phage portal protein